MSNIFIHNNFKLNGQNFQSPGNLIGYVKKNLPEHYSFIQALFNDDSSITAHTSGSTGTPKQIRIKKLYMRNSALKTIAFFDLKPQTKALLNLSSDFIAGKMMWVRALLGGWHLDVVLPDYQSIVSVLNKNRYDFGAMVPLQVFQNLDKIHHIKKLIIGGGAVSQSLLSKIYNLPNRIYATYGMTETITHIAVMPLNQVAENDFYQDDIRKGYRVLDNIHIDTDDRNCLIITAPDIADDQIITNDIVELIDNQHFRWLGRYDNIINSGGIKLIPEQIENKLKSIIEVPFFIAGLPDAKLGQKAVLILETKQIPKDLPEQIKKHLSKYEVPKNIYMLPELERTPTKKIHRQNTLRKLKINN